jgi:hypothetical protein
MQLDISSLSMHNSFVHPSAQLFAFIDTEDGLIKLIHEIDNDKELAIDLEHHSYRTFQGITCLMQVLYFYLDK